MHLMARQCAAAVAAVLFALLPETSLAQCSPGFAVSSTSTSQSDLCIPCDPGTYSDGTVIDACTACDPGTYSFSDGSRCVACEEGTYQPLPSQAHCDVCNGSVSAGRQSCADPSAPSPTTPASTPSPTTVTPSTTTATPTTPSPTTPTPSTPAPTTPAPTTPTPTTPTPPLVYTVAPGDDSTVSLYVATSPTWYYPLTGLTTQPGHWNFVNNFMDPTRSIENEGPDVLAPAPLEGAPPALAKTLVQLYRFDNDYNSGRDYYGYIHFAEGEPWRTIGSFSYAAWVYWDGEVLQNSQDPGADDAICIAYQITSPRRELGDGDATDDYFIFIDRTTQKLSFYSGWRGYTSGAFRGRGPATVSSEGTISNDIWTHVAVTYDDATQILTFFINGVASGTATVMIYQPKTKGSQAFGFGINPFGFQSYFSGFMTHHAFWDRALSAGEVASLVPTAAPVGTVAPPPVRPPVYVFTVKVHITGAAADPLSSVDAYRFANHVTRTLVPFLELTTQDASVSDVGFDAATEYYTFTMTCTSQGNGRTADLIALSSVLAAGGDPALMSSFMVAYMGYLFLGTGNLDGIELVLVFPAVVTTSEPTLDPTATPTPVPTPLPTSVPLPLFSSFTRPTKWQFAAVQACTWTPALGGSLVYTLHPGYTLYARAATTGTAVWTYSSTTTKKLVGGATYHAATQTVVVPTNGSLLILDAVTGNINYEVALPQLSGVPCKEGVPVIVDLGAPRGPAAVFATTRGKVFAVLLNSGAFAWTADLGMSNAVSAPVALWNNNVIIGTYSGVVARFDVSTGAPLGSYTAPGVTRYIPNGPISGIRAGMLVVGDVLYFSTCTSNNNFHALNLVTSQPVWTTPLTLSSGFFSYTTPTVTADGNILTTTSDGKLFTVTPSGSQVGMYDTTLQIAVFGSIPVYNNDVALVQTTYGKLHVVRLATGARVDVWYNVFLGSFSSTPALDATASRVYQCGGSRDGSMDFSYV